MTGSGALFSMQKTSFRPHLLCWLAFASYELLGVFVDGGAPLRIALWMILSTLARAMFEFYLCYLVVFPRLLRPGRAPALVGALLGVMALYIGLRYGIEEVLYPALLGFRNYAPGTTATHYLIDNFYFSIPAIAISGAVWAGTAVRQREEENQQLRAEKRAAEVAFLKSQINPHFLYNTLNLLYGMAYPVAKPLAAAILQLAELMRYMLRESPDGQVALTQEIEYLHNFLGLYRLRFPEKLFVDFAVTGDPAGHRVAALVLIPFVENAFKHGVLDDAAAPVRIALALTPGALVLTVSNRISDYAKDATSGIGLPNIRRRLELLYHGRHTLHVCAEAGRFETVLRLAQ